MLTPKMKRIADDIGGIILQDYDRDYLSLILANGLIIEDIIFQVLVECCRYAYLLKAEKHPLKYYIERDRLELDLARKEIKRTIDYTNEKFDLVEKEHKKNFEDKLSAVIPRAAHGHLSLPRSEICFPLTLSETCTAGHGM